MLPTAVELSFQTRHRRPYPLLIECQHDGLTKYRAKCEKNLSRQYFNDAAQTAWKAPESMNECGPSLRANADGSAEIAVRVAAGSIPQQTDAREKIERAQTVSTRSVLAPVC